MKVEEWKKKKEAIYENDNEIKGKMISGRLLVFCRSLYTLFSTDQLR